MSGRNGAIARLAAARRGEKARLRRSRQVSAWPAAKIRATWASECASLPPTGAMPASRPTRSSTGTSARPEYHEWTCRSQRTIALEPTEVAVE